MIDLSLQCSVVSVFVYGPSAYTCMELFFRVFEVIEAVTCLITYECFPRIEEEKWIEVSGCFVFSGCVCESGSSQPIRLLLIHLSLSYNGR